MFQERSNGQFCHVMLRKLNKIERELTIGFGKKFTAALGLVRVVWGKWLAKPDWSQLKKE